MVFNLRRCVMKKTVAVAAILLVSSFAAADSSQGRAGQMQAGVQGVTASSSSSTVYVKVGYWSGHPDLDQSILNDLNRPSQADPPGSSDSPTHGFWSGHPDLDMSILNDVGRPSPKGPPGNSDDPRHGYWSGHPDLDQSILNGV
jgi:hypothetical protein